MCTCKIIQKGVATTYIYIYYRNNVHIELYLQTYIYKYILWKYIYRHTCIHVEIYAIEICTIEKHVHYTYAYIHIIFFLKKGGATRRWRTRRSARSWLPRLPPRMPLPRARRRRSKAEVQYWSASTVILYETLRGYENTFCVSCVQLAQSMVQARFFL